MERLALGLIPVVCRAPFAVCNCDISEIHSLREQVPAQQNAKTDVMRYPTQSNVAGYATTPIFVHGMWRTGSTYIWKKFLDQSIYRAYYEPLHERLSCCKLSQDPVDPSERAAKARRLRHPEVTRSYFAEYPVTTDRRVLYYDVNFAYKRYHLADTEADIPLERYLNHLIAFAMAQEQVPVFQFNRALLRAAWLSRRFSSRSILLLRRPFDVWKSFLSSGYYYATVLCMIVGQNISDSLIGPIAAKYNIPHFSSGIFQRDASFYHSVSTARRQILYDLFYEFYTLTCAFSIAAVDCVIDMNATTESAAVREAINGHLKSLGIYVSLGDCKMPLYDRSRMDVPLKSTETAARRFVRGLLPPSTRRDARSSLIDHRAWLSPEFEEILTEILM